MAKYYDSSNNVIKANRVCGFGQMPKVKTKDGAIPISNIGNWAVQDGSGYIVYMDDVEFRERYKRKKNI